MPVEIEAKMKVDDLEKIRQQLRALNAIESKTIDEINTFFDTADRALLAKDEGLRVRRNRDARTGQDKIVITFKGARQTGAVKQREELELTVENQDDAIALLSRLGYAPTLTFEKKRQLWELDDCEIALDDLKELGTFVEIEGPDEGCVLRLREQLGLSDIPQIKDSYAALVQRHRDAARAREFDGT
jgi:adenylate cyclase class 2